MKKYLKLKIGEANYNALRPVILWTIIALIPCAIFAYFDYPILNYLLDNPKYLWALIWVLFALFSGWAEAILFDKYSNINIHLSINPHILLNTMRLFVWLPLIPLIGIKCAGSLVLIFPFIHDGKYYAHRNTLNAYVYLNRFWANPSDSSSAIVDLPLLARIICFVLGCALLVIN